MRPAQEAAADPTDGTDLAAVVAERIEAVGTGLAPGCLDWAEAMDDLPEAFLREMPAGDGGPSLAALDAAVLVRRRTLRLLDVSLHGTVGLDLRNNLAVDLSSRYRRAGGLQDLLDACSLGRQVLAGSGPGDLLAAAASLAGRLSMLARNPGHEAELDDAIRLLSEALAQGSPDRAHYLNNWAMWVTDRWERTGDPTALGQAIELLDSALAAVAGDGQLRATISFNLGVRWQEKFERDLNRGEADWADLQRACDLLDDPLAADLPHVILPAGKRLGDIAWRVSMWPETEHALRLAMTAAGELSGLRPLRPDKRRARSGVQGIGALAALCAARSGDAQAAAVHLEQASAMLLAEALGVRGDTIRFGDITGACRSMGRSLLFLGSTPAVGLAVLVDEGGGCQVAELPLLTDEAVLAATTAFRKVLADAMADSGDGTEDPLEACYAAGSRFLDWTWTSVLAPLDELLARMGGLAVLPLGQLAWLPLTAAGPPGMAPALAPHEPVLLIRATAGRESPLAGDRAAPPEVAPPEVAPPPVDCSPGSSAACAGVGRYGTRRPGYPRRPRRGAEDSRRLPRRAAPAT